jgi:hypothetical protein
MNRVLSVTRFQLVTWPATLGWPWGILAASFLVNLGGFAAMGDELPDGRQTGGLLSIYVVTLIAAAQSITQFFPFALGLSVTRRTFYAATALLLIAESLLFGVLLYLLKLIETGTGGWGVSLRFFGLPFMGDDNPLAQILIYTVPFLVLGFIGIFTALVFKRWGMNGLFTLAVSTLLVLGGLAVFLTWQRHWPAIGNWFADQAPLSLFAGWPALLALLLAGAGLLIIRRATP